MPRDLEKLSREEICVELSEKHGIDTVVRERNLGPDEDLPDNATVLDEEELLIREEIPTEEADTELLLEQHGGLLDTTTEKEREKAAKEAAKRENEQAEKAAYEFAQLQERAERRELVRVTVMALRDLPSEQRVDAARRLHEDDRISSEQLEEIIEELTPDA